LQQCQPPDTNTRVFRRPPGHEPAALPILNREDVDLILLGGSFSTGSRTLAIEEGGQIFRTLMKTEALAVEDRTVAVRYFEVRTLRGARRFSAEILLGPGDRIARGDGSVTNPEARTTCLVPAALRSRLLARTAAT
jgi:hypothetical protein